jgi:uncharacterized membrane protein (DUF2068 family)
MATHVKALGALFIALSVLGLLFALGIIVVFGFSAGIVGVAADPNDAEIAVPILGLIATGLTTFLLIVSLPGIIAGWGLLQFKPWARILGIVVSAIHLINFPVGTALGIYGLWVLLNTQTEPLFSPTSTLTHN